MISPLVCLVSLMKCRHRYSILRPGVCLDDGCDGWTYEESDRECNRTIFILYRKRCWLVHVASALQTSVRILVETLDTFTLLLTHV